jgi:hypothetical protein
MTAVARLLAKIERHCETAAIAETTFGRRAVNDGKLVKRLRAGRSITLSTLRRIEAALKAGATATGGSADGALAIRKGKGRAR